MWKDKVLPWIKENKGICIGGFIGLLIFILGLVNLIALICIVVVGMLIGHMVQNNKMSIKDSIRSFIDKF